MSELHAQRGHDDGKDDRVGYGPLLLPRQRGAVSEDEGLPDPAEAVLVIRNAKEFVETPALGLYRGDARPIGRDGGSPNEGRLPTLRIVSPFTSSSKAFMPVELRIARSDSPGDSRTRRR